MARVKDLSLIYLRGKRIASCKALRSDMGCMEVTGKSGRPKGSRTITIPTASMWSATKRAGCTSLGFTSHATLEVRLQA